MDALRALFPAAMADVVPTVAAFAAGGADDILARVPDAIARAIPRSPRRSGPGPLGSRFEHWHSLRLVPRGLSSAGVVLTRLLLGEAPEGAVAAHLGASLAALPKKDGGVRPIACGSVLRRLAARGVCSAFHDELRTAAGPLQFAVGRPAGGEVVQDCLTCLSEARPSAAFLSVDFQNAYNTLGRASILEAVGKRCPELLPVARTFCRGSTRHYWPGAAGDDAAPVDAAPVDPQARRAAR